MIMFEILFCLKLVFLEISRNCLADYELQPDDSFLSSSFWVPVEELSAKNYR